MASEQAIVYGIFKEEIKNRFLCLVTVGFSDVVCYIPSSCRLSNFLDLTGRRVMLVPTASKKARTQYSVYAVEYRHRLIPLNLALANRVIENQIRSRRFAFLGKRGDVLREHFADGYKADLYIENTKTILEIKSILSFDREAVFPTVYSERGVKQLEKLLKLIDKGYKVAYIFIALNPQTKAVQLNHEIVEYASLFSACIQKGMHCHAYAVRLTKDNTLEIKKEIVVEI